MEYVSLTVEWFSEIRYLYVLNPYEKENTKCAITVSMELLHRRNILENYLHSSSFKYINVYTQKCVSINVQMLALNYFMW